VFSASWRAALTGALVAALATVPGLGVGTLWDNSETAYGEVAREILVTHDWVVMHHNGLPWYVQPPLYFWIAALIAKILGVSEFTLRLPSALATIAMAGAAGYVVARVATPRAGLLAATVLSTSLMQAVVGRLAIMDALLDLFVALAILCWFGALRTGERRLWYGGWIALALATLDKGLVAPAVTFLVIAPWLVWESRAGRRVAWPAPVAWLGGCALFLLLVVPWAVALLGAAGPIAFDRLVSHYTVGRYLGTIENQNGPVWYYVPVLILAVFPWFPFLVPAVLEGSRDARESSGSLARLALVWAVVPFIFFSLAQTKLPNYIALELSAFAILIGVWFDRVVDRADRRAALAWASIVPVTIVVLAFALSVFSRDNRTSAAFEQLSGALIALGSAMFLGSCLCFAFLLKQSTARLGPFALGAASVLVMAIIAVFGEPTVEHLKPIPHLAAVINAQVQPSDVVAIQNVAGGNALIFYTRRHVAVLGGPAPDDHPRHALCYAPRAFLVISRRWQHYPTYGRSRREIGASNDDVLYLYDGPECGRDGSAARPAPKQAWPFRAAGALAAR